MAKKSKLHLHDYNIGGKQAKKTKALELRENKTLDKIVLSKATVKPGQQTKLEILEGEERVCFFLNGHATVHMNGVAFTVQPKDVILMPEGTTFYIENYSGHVDLDFNIVSTLI